MDSWLWTEKGVTTRCFNDGTRVVLTERPRLTTVGPGNGAWQISQSNGFVGTMKEYKKAMEVDHNLGVPIEYLPVRGRNGNTAYNAVFADRLQKRRWLKAHKRVDHDACYGDPAPGDFR